jgi:hypothetical protein
MSEDAYRDGAFVARVHEWARDAATPRGTVRGEIEQFHVRPWSTVFRVPTTNGLLYLKCCGPTQSFEPRLTELLGREHPALVPDVVAVHPTEPWMLVADGGRRADAVYTGAAILDAWREVLPRYAELERATTSHTDAALAVGTPDHRSGALVAGFARAIADEPSLSRERDDRITPEERSALERVVPAIDEACGQLASLGIGDTVQHNDLHQANLLIREGRAVVFDWGDACVSHPFLSLAVTLRFAASKVRASPDGPEILALRDAYLEPWSDRAATSDLRAGADLARRLGEVSRVLTSRAVAAAYPGVFDQYPGGFAGSLRRILRSFA